ncbi:hypothetical protein JR338_05895 [Chloroflexota bacterium]|nr:hypothetical protein JR338_05895 [Chloroflexota bacterium]
MKKIPFVIAAILIGFLLFIVVTVKHDATLFESPYTVKIIVYNHPRNMYYSLRSGNEGEGSYSTRVLEGYLIYRFSDLSNDDEIKIQVVGGGTALTFSIEPPSKPGNFFYTLNLKTREIKEGREPIRSILIAAFRVGFISLLEALILWSVDLEHTRGWKILLWITAISQIILNFFIDSNARISAEGAFLVTILSIYILIIFDLIVIPLFLKKEQDKQDEVLIINP